MKLISTLRQIGLTKLAMTVSLFCIVTVPQAANAQNAPQAARRQPAQLPAANRAQPAGRLQSGKVRLAQADAKPQKEDSEAMKKADQLYGTGNLVAAADQYREVIRQEPDNAKAHQRLGAVLAGLASDPRSKGSDDYDTAILEEKQAAKLDPKSHLPHVILGQIYANQRKYDEAIKEFKQACELKPQSYKAHLDLGIACTNPNVDRLDDAIEAYKKAANLKPDQPVPYVNMAVALQGKGQFKEGIEAAKKGISLMESGGSKQPDQLAVAYMNLGNIYADAGQNDEALDAYEHSLKCQKGNPYAMSGVGWMQHRKGNIEEAVKTQRKVLKQHPELTFARSRLAAALADQGKTEAAKAEFDQCLKGPPDPVAMFEYGQFLQRNGEKDKARSLFQQALKAQPTYKPAKEALARLDNGKQTK